MNGPALAARGDRVAAVWFTRGGDRAVVRVARSADGGRSFAAPLDLAAGDCLGRVAAAWLPDHSLAVVWLARPGRDGELRLGRVRPDGGCDAVRVLAPMSPARASGFPTLAAGGPAALLSFTQVGDQSRVAVLELTLAP